MHFVVTSNRRALTGIQPIYPAKNQKIYDPLDANRSREDLFEFYHDWECSADAIEEGDSPSNLTVDDKEGNLGDHEGSSAIEAIWEGKNFRRRSSS